MMAVELKDDFPFPLQLPEVRQVSFREDVQRNYSRRSAAIIICLEVGKGLKGRDEIARYLTRRRYQHLSSLKEAKYYSSRQKATLFVVFIYYSHQPPIFKLL